MAELPDFRGYWFQRGIEMLRRSVQTGLAALNSEKDLLEQQLEAYRQGGKFEGECDEDGSILWERDMFLECETASVNEASAELRRAFAIAAYHFWERSVQSRSIQEQESGAATAKKLRTFECLCQEAEKLGYLIDSRLSRVNIFVNTLKHNNEDKGCKLLKLWPDLFTPEFQVPPSSGDWAQHPSV